MAVRRVVPLITSRRFLLPSLPRNITFIAMTSVIHVVAAVVLNGARLLLCRRPERLAPHALEVEWDEVVALPSRHDDWQALSLGNRYIDSRNRGGRH